VNNIPNKQDRNWKYYFPTNKLTS